MEMMCDFDEAQTFDNAAILRNLSSLQNEYPITQWMQWVECKCREMGLPVPSAYRKLGLWMAGMDLIDRGSFFHELVQSNPANEAYWLQQVYLRLVKLSEQELMEKS